jgi:hypothetical protein
MTPAEEASFVELWGQGLTTDAIAAALGIPKGTACSRAYALQQAGKIQPRSVMRAKRARGQAATQSYQPAAPNHPVERTAHSVGAVLMRGFVPVGRRSPGALGFVRKAAVGDLVENSPTVTLT